MPRYALKVYYDGSNFFGSQRQPNQRTVEGELLSAFKKLGAKIEKFQSAGRTDKGVSAFGNVFAVTTQFELKARALNSFLPGDVRVLAISIPAMKQRSEFTSIFCLTTAMILKKFAAQQSSSKESTASTTSAF